MVVKEERTCKIHMREQFLVNAKNLQNIYNLESLIRLIS